MRARAASPDCGVTVGARRVSHVLQAAIGAALVRGDDMTEMRSERAVPSEFTSSPVRNRLQLELDASVSEVWALTGDLSRFPEYSEGLERVEVVLGDDGGCLEYTCYFKPVEVDGESLSPVSRDLMKWYEPQ